MQIADFVAIIDEEIRDREILRLGLLQDIEMLEKMKEKCSGKVLLPLDSILDTMREASIEVHGKNIFKLIGDKGTCEN